MRSWKNINHKTISFGVAFLVAVAILVVMTVMPRRYPLAIETESGLRQFRVELAETPAEQQKGLMFRETLENDKGMLFVFPDSREASFWMKNTLIPLDIIFIDADRVIHHIHADAVPHDETPISSNGKIIAVLEIPGGQAKSQDIKTGDIVKTPLLAGTRK